MELHNARVIVTGGSAGIGKATAQLLIEAGAHVAITGRDKRKLDEVSRALGVIPIHADVSKEQDVIRTYQEALSRLGGLDCLVNNAGIGVHKPLVELSASEMTEVWSVNVLGAALMAREAAKIFIKQKSGNIINVASTSGTRGYESGTAYVASKFALRGMSECWRAELRKFNVRVMTVNPSEVPTAFGSKERTERPEQPNKLRSLDIAYAIKTALEMDDRGFIPELTVFATNPF